MCGIAGIVSSTNTHPTEQDVQRLIDPIAHRGPDDFGIEVIGRAGLGHRRLAILDLSPAGHNPMFSADGRYAIIFNGESYNFLEHRADLEQKGYTFRSHSDTEVLLYLYVEYGAAMIQKIDGMFAFAIWDKQEEVLFAARDRMGKKPFYYSESKGQLVFGSEIKSLLNDPRVSHETDPESVYAFLHLHYLPAPLTGFRFVRKLPAAHTLTWKKGEITVERYWDYSYIPKHDISFDEAKKETLRLLRHSVKQRMISDVPLGAHLSGGLDSSLVVALMAEASSTPVKTFSIGFDDPDLNELPYAEQVAQTFSTDHQSIFVDANFQEALPELARLYDEPYADAAALPYYFLSQETRKHVTVALNGDGGDENFAGYRRYLTYDQLLHLSFVHRLAARTSSLYSWALNAQWKKRIALLHAAQQSKNPLALFRLVKQPLFPSVVDASLAPGFQEQLQQRLVNTFWQQHWDAVQADELIEKAVGCDIRMYLADGLTKKVDMAAMGHSLEARSPFLDYKLIEWTARLPLNMKIRGGETKVLERAIAQDLLPQEIFQRKKQPFLVPLDRWFRAEWSSMARELLLSPNARIHEYVQREYIQRMIDEHVARKQNHGTALYAYIMLEHWLQRHA